MESDLRAALEQFHREVFLPDFKRIVRNAVEGSERRVIDRMRQRCDELCRKIDGFRAPSSTD